MYFIKFNKDRVKNVNKEKKEKNTDIKYLPSAKWKKAENKTKKKL